MFDDEPTEEMLSATKVSAAALSNLKKRKGTKRYEYNGVEKHPVGTRLLLVDADILAFKAASSVETVTDWGGDLFTLHADLYEAKRTFDEMVDNLVTRLQCGSQDVYVHLFFTGKKSPNFRIQYCPEYKANRKGVRAPICLAALREYACKTYANSVSDGVEADDLIGISVTSLHYTSPDCIVCSSDKDMKTLPCTLYNWETDEITVISGAMADYNHLYQTLVGDATDNYSGLKGFGPVKATKLLSKYRDLNTDYFDTEAATKAVFFAFEENGSTMEQAINMGHCARILRMCDVQGNSLWYPDLQTFVQQGE